MYRILLLLDCMDLVLLLTNVGHAGSFHGCSEVDLLLFQEYRLLSYPDFYFTFIKSISQTATQHDRHMTRAHRGIIQVHSWGAWERR
ncbi:hypothetical protein AcW1_008968 [Taiwanofungus camphoratus]|nr:hypothetical protein AcW1_008968 [Antrodia cinnamomea]